MEPKLIISIINKDHSFPSIYMGTLPYRVSMTSLPSVIDYSHRLKDLI